MSFRNIINKINEKRDFLLFILIFAYLQSIYKRIVGRQQINAYTFTPESAILTLMCTCILFFIILFFIRKWKKKNIFELSTILKIFSLSLIVFVSSMLLIGFLTALIFDTFERNFNPHTLSITLVSHLLDGIIYGSFFLTYYYYQSNINHQKRLAIYNAALSESKVNHLKFQLNPHFLFNNLNVLDQLIEEDKQKASDFLNEFADIYRYVLQSTEDELVSIEKELEFAKQYFKLIGYKYEESYQLHIEGQITSGFIVPMTLQLLLENAIKHNLGNKDNPICVQIKIDSKISVSNNINLISKRKSTSGRALKNLKEQYALLSKSSIEVYQSDNTFSVFVPIIF